MAAYNQSHLTYVKVSDMNPGEYIPLDIGYRFQPPPQSLYENSTWDIYGGSQPPYPSGSDGSMYVPDYAVNRPHGFLNQGQGGGSLNPLGGGGSGGIRQSYHGPAPYDPAIGRSPYDPAIGQGPYAGGVDSRSYQSSLPAYPGFGPGPVPPEKKGRAVEGFGTGRPTGPSQETPLSTSTGSTIPLDDPVFVVDSSPKKIQLKNPVLVSIFLLAVYGAFTFFWLGVDQYLTKKYAGGQPSWKLYLGWALAIFVVTMMASYLLDFSFLKLEELSG